LVGARYLEDREERLRVIDEKRPHWGRTRVPVEIDPWKHVLS